MSGPRIRPAHLTGIGGGWGHGWEMWKGVSGMVRNPLVAVEVEGGFWMLLHMGYGMLLRDFGWFPSRHAAEDKALELAQLLGPARSAVIHGGYDAALLN